MADKKTVMKVIIKSFIEIDRNGHNYKKQIDLWKLIGENQGKSLIRDYATIKNFNDVLSLTYKKRLQGSKTLENGKLPYFRSSEIDKSIDRGDRNWKFEFLPNWTENAFKNKDTFLYDIINEFRGK